MSLCMTETFPKRQNGVKLMKYVSFHTANTSRCPVKGYSGLWLYLWICGLCRALDSDEEYIDLSVRCGCRRRQMGCHDHSSACQSGRWLYSPHCLLALNSLLAVLWLILSLSVWSASSVTCEERSCTERHTQQISVGRYDSLLLLCNIA